MRGRRVFGAGGPLFYGATSRRVEAKVSTPHPNAGLSAAVWFWAAASGLAAVAGLTAAWTGLSVYFRDLCLWMLPVVAFDAALLLALAGVPGGRLRLGLALLVTTATVLASAWTVTAAQIGMALGVRPPDAFTRIGPGMVQLYLQAQLRWTDALWLLAAVLAALAFERIARRI